MTSSNIEKTKIKRYKRQIRERGTPQVITYLASDLGVRNGLMDLDQYQFALLQAKQMLRSHGIASVVVEGIVQKQDAMVISIRWFPNLDVIQGVETVPQTGLTHYFKPLSPTASLHWRKRLRKLT